MRRRLLQFFLAVAVSAAGLSLDESRSAAEKLDRIMTDQLAPGESVALTDGEVNSYIHYDYAELMPEGVRGLRVRFEPDVGLVAAVVDFSKLSSDAGVGGNLLLMMLRGERDLDARVRYVSSGGVAHVEVESLKIDGREMKGPILNLLINTFVAPNLESFKLGEPVPLGHNLEQVRLETGRIVFVARD